MSPQELQIIQSLRNMTRQLRQNYLYLLIHDVRPMCSTRDEINEQYCFAFQETTVLSFVLHVSSKLTDTPPDPAWLTTAESYLRDQLAQLPGDAETLAYTESKICCILGTSCPYAEVSAFLHRVFRNIQSLPGMYTCTWTMGIGRTVSDISDLHESYFSAQHALKYSITMGVGKVYDGNDQFGIFEGGLSLLQSGDELALKQSVLSLNFRETAGCIRALFQQRMDQIQSYPVYAFMLSLQIIQISLQALRERMPIDRKTYELERAYEDIIDEQSTLDGLLTNTIQGTLSLCERYRQFTEQGRSRPIWLTLTYIQEHYTEHIPLDTLASLADRNPQYLSAAFTRELGLSITDYIAALRLERAKELLRTTGLPVGEIGTRVGYSDPKYFSRIFTKRVGETPQTFRHRHSSDG